MKKKQPITIPKEVYEIIHDYVMDREMEIFCEWCQPEPQQTEIAELMPVTRWIREVEGRPEFEKEWYDAYYDSSKQTKNLSEIRDDKQI